MTPTKSARSGSLWKIVLVLLFAAVAIDRGGGARAQDAGPAADPSTTADAPADQPVATEPEHVPGTPYQDGPGEIAYDQMSAGDKALADSIAAHHDAQAAAVAESWSAVTHDLATQAAASQAAHQAGASGLDEVGVK